VPEPHTTPRVSLQEVMSLLSRLFGAPDPTSAPRVVDVHEASRRQSAGALLIDVRQPEEWNAGHAPNAKLIPLGSLGDRLVLYFAHARFDG